MRYKYKLVLGIFLVFGACSQKPAEVVMHTTTSPTKNSYTTNNPYKVIVQNGDTLYSIAKKNNVEIRDLIELNRLRAPYRLIAGQSVKLPNAAFHIVGENDNLYAISRSYNVDISRLAQKNHLSQPYNLAKGQRLFLPSATANEASVVESKSQQYDYSTKEATLPSSTAVASSDLAPIGIKEPAPFSNAKTEVKTDTKSNQPIDLKVQDNKGVAPFSYKSEKEFGSNEKIKEEVKSEPSKDNNNKIELFAEDTSPKIIDKKPQAVAPVTEERSQITESLNKVDTTPATSSKANFIWPTKGMVISGFGAKKGGLYNDGINISAKEGAPIKAADDGDIVYAGNELRGYGNMLLIKHNNGYLTAYAHTNDILVRKGDVVKKGQLIAHVGKTGHVSTPQLHFSIRQGRKAIDPEKYLPTDFSMTTQ